MSAPSTKKSPLRWLFLAGAALTLLKDALVAVVALLLQLPGSGAGIIGGADGPTAIVVTMSILPEALLCRSLSLAAALLAAFFVLQWPAPRAKWKLGLIWGLLIAALLLWVASVLLWSLTTDALAAGAAVVPLCLFAGRKLRR